MAPSRSNTLSMPSRRELLSGLAVLVIATGVVMTRGGEPSPTHADAPAAGPAAGERLPRETSQPSDPEPAPNESDGAGEGDAAG